MKLPIIPVRITLELNVSGGRMHPKSWNWNEILRKACLGWNNGRYGCKGESAKVYRRIRRKP